MKPKDVKAGMRAEVGVWRPIPTPNAFMGNERIDIPGKILCRRKGAVRFQPDEGVTVSLVNDYPTWTESDSETFRVPLLELVKIEGFTPKEFAA